MSVIAERQRSVRLWLLAEAENLGMVAKIDTLGKYAVNRWYRFAQLAMYNEGALLERNENWAVIEQEIRNWPMTLWISILDNDETINEAKLVYNAMSNGRITVTRHTEEGTTRPFELVQMGWAKRAIRSATQLDIWKWLGPVGGVYPERGDDAQLPGAPLDS